MGIFSFIKDAGEKLFGGSEKEASAPPKVEDLTDHLKKSGVVSGDVKVDVDGSTVKVSGKALSQEEKEKIILALGNVAGVDKVEEEIAAHAAAPEALFYEVKKGQTLSGISKEVYGDPNKYPQIFEANKPLLSHPDKIYPGQKLRIPQAA
jgi:nucleoid-associated protein YgaU